MAQQNVSTDKNTVTQAYIAGALAFLFPGAGHFYLRRYRRAALFFLCVVGLAIVGAMSNGEMYSFLRDNAGDGFLQMLAAIGNIGLGLLHLIFHIFGIAMGDIEARGYEYGTTFIIVAALINVLVVLDAWDIAKETKR
jgi:hypothetical protein